MNLMGPKDATGAYGPMEPYGPCVLFFQIRRSWHPYSFQSSGGGLCADHTGWLGWLDQLAMLAG